MTKKKEKKKILNKIKKTQVLKTQNKKIFSK